MAHFASAQMLTPLFRGVNAQTGTSYTVAFSDEGNLLTFNNSSPVVVTLPQAGSAGFPSGWFIFVENKGSGMLTITPIASTIDGASSLPLAQNQGVLLVSDGTNYATSRGTGSGGGGSGTVTSVGLAVPSQFAVSGSPVATSGTLTAAWNNQTPNTVLSGPSSGAAAAPTFRSLVKSDQVSTTVYNDQANTWTTGAQDFGAASSLKVPASAGAAPSSSGLIAYDTTGNEFRAGVNGTASKIPTFTGTDPTTGNCAKWGANGTLADQGAACGSGGVGAASFQGLSDLKVTLGTYPTINYAAGPTVYGFVPSSIAAGTKAVTTDCGYSGSGTSTVYVYATESGVSCNIAGFPASGSGFWAMAQFTLTSASFSGVTVTDQRGFRAWGITPGSGFTLAAPSTGNVQINYDSNVLADLTSAQNVMNKSSGQVFTAGTGGTTANLLVKADASNPSQAVTAATTDTGAGVVLGIALQTVSPGGSVKVATRGPATCVADNAITAGHWIQVGTTTAGRCKDAGATFPTSGDVVGQAQGSQATVGSTFTVNLDNRQRSPGGGGGGGSGTVTSVGLAMPSQFAVSGSPVTTSGTLTAAWNTQTANQVLAGPSSGAAAVPTFRAIAAGDVPAVNLAAGGNGGVTGTLSVGSGGTGATTFTANSLLKGNGTSAVQASSVTDNGTTVSTSESLQTTAPGAGSLTSLEGSNPTGSANNDILSASSGSHAWIVNENNTANMTLTKTFNVNVTPVTVSAAVATDQNLMALTIPANTLNIVGRTLHIWVAGTYSTPASSTATVNLKAKLCSVSGCGSGTVVNLASITSSANPGSVTNNPFNLQLYSTTQTAGTSSVYEAHGSMQIDLGAATTSALSSFGDTNTALSSPVIDSTAQMFLQITVAFSAASTSNSAKERQLVVEVLN